MNTSALVKTNAVRAAYAKFSPEEKCDIDILAEDARECIHKRLPSIKFGKGSAVELVGKLGMFLCEWEEK